jgi:hypothetical protein
VQCQWHFLPWFSFHVRLKFIVAMAIWNHSFKSRNLTLLDELNQSSTKFNWGLKNLENLLFLPKRFRELLNNCHLFFLKGV